VKRLLEESLATFKPAFAAGFASFFRRLPRYNRKFSASP
jgi:hypothetical protein